MNDPQTDQEHAARRDASRLIGHLHERMGGNRVDGKLGEISRKWRDEFVANCQAGVVMVCEHARSPFPFILNAWSLWRMMCPQCNAHYQHTHPDEADDFQCDGCGLIDREITPVAHQLGQILLIGGMCRYCVQIERATDGEE